MAQAKKSLQASPSVKGPKSIYSVVNVSKVVAQEHATTTTLSVAVRVRPILKMESAKGGRKDILRVIDSRVVVVLDPDDQKATNADVYEGSMKELVGGVTQGLNATVFAYGATGSGKTHTMVGKPEDPGLMVLSLEHIFKDIESMQEEEDFDVTCSYLEVYNEIIYDLLITNSGGLDLREDPELGVVVAGLCKVNVETPKEILMLLEDGNKRRKTESTDANSQSSRSHAVLEIVVRRVGKTGTKVKQFCAKLSLVDLAGSERAAETNNVGSKLRDGANINKSLLALANCINALGKQQKNGIAYVPYRNSKLTRLLKDGLSGNSRTAMIATVSASSDQYHHSINTLKYADRAKEIKTHIVQNIGTIETHIADYKRMIDSLQTEVLTLRTALEEVQTTPADPSADIVWVEALAAEINENVEERINLQKALFELEDLNVVNRAELKTLDEFLDSVDLSNSTNADIADARRRRAVVLESIKDNEDEIRSYREEVDANEQARKDIQARIESQTINQSPTFLRIINTYRIQAVKLQELKFQMAVRDQVISEQRDVISNLWRIMEAAGMGRDRILDLAQQEGILMDDFTDGTEVLSDGTPALGAIELQRAMQAVKGMRDNGDLAQILRSADVRGMDPNAQNGKGRVQAVPSLLGRTADYKYRFWSKRLPSDYKVAGVDHSSDDGASDAPTTVTNMTSNGASNGRRTTPNGRSKVHLPEGNMQSSMMSSATPPGSSHGTTRGRNAANNMVTPPRRPNDLDGPGAAPAAISQPKFPNGSIKSGPTAARMSRVRVAGPAQPQGTRGTAARPAAGPIAESTVRGRTSTDGARLRNGGYGSTGGYDSDNRDNASTSTSSMAWDDGPAGQRMPSKLGQAPLSERLAKVKQLKKKPLDGGPLSDDGEITMTAPGRLPELQPMPRRYSDGNGGATNPIAVGPAAITERTKSFLQLHQQAQQQRREVLNNLNLRPKVT